jgi:hypothetical protein
LHGFYKHYRCVAPGFFKFLIHEKQRQRREKFVAIAVCLGFKGAEHHNHFNHSSGFPFSPNPTGKTLSIFFNLSANSYFDRFWKAYYIFACLHLRKKVSPFGKVKPLKTHPKNKIIRFENSVSRAFALRLKLPE